MSEDLPADYLQDEGVRLFLAWQNGDERSFARLYALWKVRLLRSLTHMTRDRAWAEEVFQETWMTVIQHRMSYEPRARFGTWLFSVARSRMIDSARKAGRRAPTTSLADTHFEIADEGDDTFDLALVNQYLAAFQRCLPTLPDEQCEAFVLRTQQDMEWNEIATITQSSAEAARSRFRYATVKLKNCMGLT